MSVPVQFWSCAGSTRQAARHGWEDSVSWVGSFKFQCFQNGLFFVFPSDFFIFIF